MANHTNAISGFLSWPIVNIVMKFDKFNSLKTWNYFSLFLNNSWSHCLKEKNLINKKQKIQNVKWKKTHQKIKMWNFVLTIMTGLDIVQWPTQSNYIYFYHWGECLYHLKTYLMSQGCDRFIINSRWVIKQHLNTLLFIMCTNILQNLSFTLLMFLLFVPVHTKKYNPFVL
jgi:hypothetical protein